MFFGTDDIKKYWIIVIKLIPNPPKYSTIMIFTILSKIHTIVFLFQIVRDTISAIRLPLNSSCIDYDIDYPIDMTNSVSTSIHTQQQESDILANETETDIESEYAVDEEYADMEYAEETFEQTDKIDGHYYLGVPFTFRSIGQTVMNCSISPNTFFENEYSRVGGYLQHIATFYLPYDPFVDILQLHITDNGEYAVVVKTIWLRIIQRAWKKRLETRNKVFAKRASVQNQEYFRRHGRYLPGTNVIPGLRGLLTSSPINPM